MDGNECVTENLGFCICIIYSPKAGAALYLVYDVSGLFASLEIGREPHLT